MRSATVVTLHPYDDEEALQWLYERLEGQIEMRVSELARQFGWPRTRLRRRLAAWSNAGQISQHAGSKGKIVLAPVAGRRGEEGGPFSRQAAVRLVERAFSTETPRVYKPANSLLVRAAAGLLSITAVCLFIVGLAMNARFAASFGQTIEAAILLAAIGLAVDLLAVLLPTVGAELWRRRAVVSAMAAWSIWVAALTMSLLAATGFAATNIGDAVAGRDKIVSESASLRDLIGQLRAERATITETRAAAAIDAELQQAQPGAQAVWKITSGCRDVTRQTSARACVTVQQLREAFATAERRDALDAQLRQSEARLAGLPPLVAADPQAKTAAEVIAWITAGHLKPGERDIAWLRTIGLALAPSFAGVVALLALLLVRGRRP